MFTLSNLQERMAKTDAYGIVLTEGPEARVLVNVRNLQENDFGYVAFNLTDDQAFAFGMALVRRAYENKAI